MYPFHSIPLGFGPCPFWGHRLLSTATATADGSGRRMGAGPWENLSRAWRRRRVAASALRGVGRKLPSEPCAEMKDVLILTKVSPLWVLVFRNGPR